MRIMIIMEAGEMMPLISCVISAGSRERQNQSLRCWCRVHRMDHRTSLGRERLLRTVVEDPSLALVGNREAPRAVVGERISRLRQGADHNNLGRAMLRIVHSKKDNNKVDPMDMRKLHLGQVHIHLRKNPSREGLAIPRLLQAVQECATMLQVKVVPAAILVEGIMRTEIIDNSSRYTVERVVGIVNQCLTNKSIFFFTWLGKLAFVG
mmetsp:Transcript_10413/g.16983  ORF Transcript_10413/g.16983 Transcript_10413/m.16983 type:complete len:208 (-) Transcript_10413:1234-1857(-)